MRTGAAALSKSVVSPKASPNVDKMNFVLRTKTKNVTVPLNEPIALWKKAEFDTELPLVIFVTGWTTNFNDNNTNSALETVYKAYECRGNVNFVVSLRLNTY